MTPEILLIGVILAQEAPTPTGFQLIDLVTTLGVSGLFVFLYFDERKERRQVQQQMAPLLERIIAALTESTSTLDRVQDSLKSSRSADGSDLKTEINQLIMELRSKQ